MATNSLDPTPLPSPPNPGASSTAVLYTDVPPSGAPSSGTLPFSRVSGTVFVDTACTILVQTKSTLTGTWRTNNGNGAGDQVIASQLATFDYVLLGKYNQVIITTVSAPGAWDINVQGQKNRAKP